MTTKTIIFFINDDFNIDNNFDNMNVDINDDFDEMNMKDFPNMILRRTNSNNIELII